MLERLSKITVVVSACAAVLTAAWLGAREWPPLLWLTPIGLVGGVFAGRRFATRSWAFVFSIAYIVPALFLLTRGHMRDSYWMLWISALLGAVIGNLDFRRWTFPSRWKWPLAYWALAVALVWPVVAAREADFSWAMMTRINATGGLGGPPPVIAIWIASVALTHMVCLLWFDAALTRFPLTDRAASLDRFTRHVVWPLAAGVFVGSAIAIYQATIDINWLSGHQWPFYQRAAGSLDDGNAFGPLAGLWTGAFLALVAISRSGARRSAAVLGAALAFAGLWATGSRMALLAALISVAFALWFVVTHRKWSRRDLALIGVPAFCVLAALAIFVSRSSTASPIDRVRASLPGLSQTEIRKFVGFELWNRYGPFGTAAVDMVRTYPLTGIGLASFNHIFPDYAFVITGNRAHIDNAQSWYRHELAELGILGSLGWLIWLPMFAWVLFRARADIDKPFAGTMVKAALVAVGVVSAISLTQSLAVTLTVWMLVLWFLLLSSDATAIAEKPWRLSGRAIWGVATWTLVLLYVAETARVGWRDLRPPYRALRADWTYQVGVLPPESVGSGPTSRWTEQHAAMVWPANGRWLKLTVSGGPPDIGQKPVRLEIKRRGKKIIAVTRQDASAMTWYVENADEAPRMMLEFDVSRAWRPSQYGVAQDDRDLGVMVDDWTFVSTPPRGAVVIRDGPEKTPAPPAASLASEILADQSLAVVLAKARALLETGLNAGSGYEEIWIRDLNTFVELAAHGKQSAEVRAALLTLIKFQGATGDIPDGVTPKKRAPGRLERESALAPGLIAHKNTVETDQETSLVQAVRKYINVTGDRSFLDERVAGRTVLERLDLALNYVMTQRFDRSRGLIWGATTADWGDVQPETEFGIELDGSSHRAIDVYDNAMLAIAIEDYLELLPAGSRAIPVWAKRHADIKSNIRKHLWDAAKQKFIPHIYLAGSPFPKDFDEAAIYYHGGTAVAIEAGILSHDEIAVSIAAIQENVRKAGAGSVGLTIYPAYPAGFFKKPLMQPYDYQNGGDWPWFGGRLVRQMIRNGFVREAYAALQPMVARVINDQDFYEFWTLDNRPRGSAQFRGTAGVLGSAIEELRAWASRPSAAPPPKNP